LPASRAAVVGKPSAVRRRLIIAQAMGIGRYEVIAYQLEPAAQGVGSCWTSRPRLTSTFLYPAIDAQNIDSNSFSLTFARGWPVRHPVADSEVRVDAGLGTRSSLPASFYRRFGRSHIFIAPRAYASRTASISTIQTASSSPSTGSRSGAPASTSASKSSAPTRFVSGTTWPT